MLPPQTLLSPCIVAPFTITTLVHHRICTALVSAARPAIQCCRHHTMERWTGTSSAPPTTAVCRWSTCSEPGISFVLTILIHLFFFLSLFPFFSFFLSFFLSFSLSLSLSLCLACFRSYTLFVCCLDARWSYLYNYQSIFPIDLK